MRWSFKTIHCVAKMTHYFFFILPSTATDLAADAGCRDCCDWLSSVRLQHWCNQCPAKCEWRVHTHTYTKTEWQIPYCSPQHPRCVLGLWLYRNAAPSLIYYVLLQLSPNPCLSVDAHTYTLKPMSPKCCLINLELLYTAPQGHFAFYLHIISQFAFVKW